MTDQAERVDLSTPDIAATNREALEALFPGVLADGVLDANRLGELLDVPVTAPADGRERFGLMWAGKHEAVRSLLTPSRGTLVPDLENSVGFDTAQNVFIEGDNLEVLKLLQKAYNDKVKLIYIDPPYNTGTDFVYNDDFSDGLRAYLEYTGQLDGEGNRTSAATETSGRRHSQWLSMMYPRLFLSRNMLRSDGAIFVSVDDTELHNLRALMDEIFDPENFVGVFIWRKKYTLSYRDQYMIPVHEYIVCYKGRGHPTFRDPRWSEEPTVAVNPVFKSQNAESTKTLRAGAKLQADHPPGEYVIPQGAVELPSQTIEYLDRAVFLDGKLQEDVRVRGRFSSGQKRLDTAQIEVSMRGAAYVAAENKEPSICPISILFDYTKNDKSYLYEQYRYRKAVSTRQATAELEDIMGAKVFDNPKPVELLASLISYLPMSDGDIVLDFFAGSGTTAHAVAQQNERDGCRRLSMSVNLPEPLAAGVSGNGRALATVADVTRERIRRTLEATSQAGLRSFSLGQSAFRAADDRGDELFDMTPSTLSDRPLSDDSIVAEVLVAEGVSLDALWSRAVVMGATVITADQTSVVLSNSPSDEVIKGVLERHPRVVVFLEDGFAGRDSIKANAFIQARESGVTMKTI